MSNASSHLLNHYPEWPLIKNQCKEAIKYKYSTQWKPCFTVYPKKYAHGFCFAVLCCGYTLTDFPISNRLTSLALPAKQPWWIWINTSCEFIMKDCITTTKQSTTKPCAYSLGYTVYTVNTNDTHKVISTYQSVMVTLFFQSKQFRFLIVNSGPFY